MSKIIQDYLLKDIIGEGQFGKVWRAENSKNGKSYAIKAISLKKVNKVQKMREFLNSEIDVLDIVEHDNIVKYFGKLQTQNNIYLIFEYCTGGTLEDKIQSSKGIQEDKAIDYFSQLVSAFEKLNSMNIMHRDIKPSNILFDDKGTLKLADFGFCKKLRGRYEMTKSIVGSPIYMAPELLQGRYYGTKVDIWSLGIMFHEMLYGKCPYQENSIPQLLNLIRRKPLNLTGNVSAKAKSLLLKMLKMTPTERISWRELFQWNRKLKRKIALEIRMTRKSDYNRREKTLLYNGGRRENSRSQRRNEIATSEISINQKLFSEINIKGIEQEEEFKKNSPVKASDLLKKGAILEYGEYRHKTKYEHGENILKSKTEMTSNTVINEINVVNKFKDLNSTKKLISDLSILGYVKEKKNQLSKHKRSGRGNTPSYSQQRKFINYTNTSIMEGIANRSQFQGRTPKTSVQSILNSDINFDRPKKYSKYNSPSFVYSKNKKEKDENLKETKYLDFNFEESKTVQLSSHEYEKSDVQKLKESLKKSENRNLKPPLIPIKKKDDIKGGEREIKLSVKEIQKNRQQRSNFKSDRPSKERTQAMDIKSNLLKQFNIVATEIDYIKVPVLEKLKKKMEKNRIEKFPIEELSLIWESTNLRNNQECFQIMQNRRMGQLILSLALDLLKIKQIPLVKNIENIIDLNIVVNSGTAFKVNSQDHEKLVLFCNLVLFKKARKFLLTTKIKASYADVIGLGNYLVEPRTLITSVRKESETFDLLYTSLLKKIGNNLLKSKFEQWKGFKTKDFDFEILEVNEEDFENSIKSPFEYNDITFKKVLKVMKDSLLEQHHFLYSKQSQEGFSNNENLEKRMKLLRTINRLIDTLYTEEFWMKVTDSMDKNDVYQDWVNDLTENEILIFLQEKLKILEEEHFKNKL